LKFSSYKLDMHSFDIIVIGAGIAGASVAAHLAKEARVCILEMEDRAGYHTTGRSAASYEPNYGPPPMLAFTRASDAFFRNPPQGFADASLLTPRTSMFFVPAGQETAGEALLSKSVSLKEISEHRATELYPVLRPGYANRIFLDMHTADIDVDLLHRGYLKLFRSAGGTLVLDAATERMERSSGTWTVQTKADTFAAPLVINAAGAWGDEIARMAGVKIVGLQPKRRSIGIIPEPDRTGVAAWPMVTDVGETWYSKPQSGKLMVSSADATPVEPHDAYADDMAIAEGIERMINATTLEIDRLEHSWGGLRTFAPDGNPVIGYDLSTEGFFWLVGQGGYGIQSAPALSVTAAELALRRTIPKHLLDRGLESHAISPERFRT
jgi:D-arginine dehydrogenase